MDPRLIRLFNEGNVTPDTLNHLGWSNPGGGDTWTYPNGNKITTNAYGYGTWSNGHESATVQLKISPSGHSSTSATSGGQTDPPPPPPTPVKDPKKKAAAPFTTPFGPGLDPKAPPSPPKFQPNSDYTYEGWKPNDGGKFYQRDVYLNGKKVGTELAESNGSDWKITNPIGPNTVLPSAPAGPGSGAPPRPDSTPKIDRAKAEQQQKVDAPLYDSEQGKTLTGYDGDHFGKATTTIDKKTGNGVTTTPILNSSGQQIAVETKKFSTQVEGDDSFTITKDAPPAKPAAPPQAPAPPSTPSPTAPRTPADPSHALHGLPVKAAKDVIYGSDSNNQGLSASANAASPGDVQDARANAHPAAYTGGAPVQSVSYLKNGDTLTTTATGAEIETTQNGGTVVVKKAAATPASAPTANVYGSSSFSSPVVDSSTFGQPSVAAAAHTLARVDADIADVPSVPVVPVGGGDTGAPATVTPAFQAQIDTANAKSNDMFSTAPTTPTPAPTPATVTAQQEQQFQVSQVKDAGLAPGLVLPPPTPYDPKPGSALTSLNTGSNVRSFGRQL